MNTNVHVIETKIHMSFDIKACWKCTPTRNPTRSCTLPAPVHQHVFFFYFTRMVMFCDMLLQKRARTLVCALAHPVLVGQHACYVILHTDFCSIVVLRTNRLSTTADAPTLPLRALYARWYYSHFAPALKMGCYMSNFRAFKCSK